MTRRMLAFVVIMGCLFLCFQRQAAGQATPQITFQSFTGIYRLSRDSNNVSLLTSEETILADFGATGSYGITRSIPQDFQGHSVSVKVLNIKDAAGSPIAYKIANDNSHNLVITTGNPKISLYGPQTIKITYQTSGVVNLGQKQDQFLLNVNGRGWDQGFGQVAATLYVPKLFNASIKGQPSCYVSPNAPANACQIETKKNDDGSVITAKAINVKAHQALVAQLNFQPATFSAKPASSHKLLYGIAALAVLTAPLYLYRRLANR